MVLSKPRPISCLNRVYQLIKCENPGKNCFNACQLFIAHVKWIVLCTDAFQVPDWGKEAWVSLSNSGVGPGWGVLGPQ